MSSMIVIVMINTPTGAGSAPSPLKALHLRVSELRRAVPRDLELDKNRQDDLLNLLSLEYLRGSWLYPIRNEFSFLGSKPILHLRPSRPLSSPPHSAINTCIYIPLYNEDIPHQHQDQARRPYSKMAQTKPVVAVLYQALPPPMYGGVSKPPKPGGKTSAKRV